MQNMKCIYCNKISLETRLSELKSHVIQKWQKLTKNLPCWDELKAWDRWTLRVLGQHNDCTIYLCEMSGNASSCLLSQIASSYLLSQIANETISTLLSPPTQSRRRWMNLSRWFAWLIGIQDLKQIHAGAFQFQLSIILNASIPLVLKEKVCAHH